MAALLDLDAAPYAPPYPLVCCAESPSHLVSDVRQPLPVAPGPPVRYDYEDRREGTWNLCRFFEPLRGWRHVKGTDRRTAQDVASWRRALVARHFPQATLMSVVLDHLTPQTPAALYATFPPAEAGRLLRKLDFHDTPKQGRWLHRAELEFAVMATRGLDRRLGNPETVGQELAAWETCRNAAQATGDWHVTTAQARRKLKHISPL